jgi:hypothetical protein
MAAISWKKAASGNWTTASDWNPARVPGAGDDATISVAGAYTVSLTSAITVHSITIGDGGALLSIDAPATTVTAGLTNGGTVDQTGATAVKLRSLTNNGLFEVADNSSGLGDAGGGRLTVTGKLTNNGDLNIGNSGLTKAETVKAASFANTPQGTVNLIGGGAAGPATLSIGAAAPATLTGAYYLRGNALIAFGSGHIATIASNSVLRLDGARSRVASGGSTGSSSALSALATNNGFFELEDHASVATSVKTFTNFGQIDVDTLDTGGSRLTIAGILNNIGDLDIGGSSLVVGGAPALVTVGGLIGSGGIELDGGPGRATLDVLGAAFSTVTSRISLDGDALLEFGSGSITAIADGGDLELDGPGARVALGSNTTTSGALAKLGSNTGELLLLDGASVATTVGFVNNGSLNIDPGFAGFFNDGGSSLKIGGTLTNNNTIDIGNDGITAATNVSANALANPGVLEITGSDTVQASLKINANAPGTLNGRAFELSGDALLQFKGGGVATIAAGTLLSLDGAKSRVASGSATGSNSALTGLTGNAGDFELEDGATVATTATKGLNNTGSLEIDQSGIGGSTLTITKMLTSSSSINIGNAGITAATKVTAGGLANTGAIDIDGGASTSATLDIKAAAPATLQNATYNLAGDALLEFASGAITAIGATGRLSLDGAKSRVTSGSATGSNSALTKLASNAGTFSLGDGAALTTQGNFANTGAVQVDQSIGAGGSNLTFGGALNNSAQLDIGSSNIIKGATVTAKTLTNTGSVSLTGGAGRSTLDIKANAPATLTGTFSLTTNALLEFAGGAITAIGSNARLSLSGKKAFVAVAGALTSDSALTKLAGNAGTLDLEQGASLSTKVGLTNTGFLEIDESNFFSGTSGGSSLAVGGALTNNDGVTIGNSVLTANTSVSTTGSLTNNLGATFTLTSGTGHAALKIGGGLTNSGFLALDEFSGGSSGSGGSSLTVTGALTNNGTLQIGNANITRATTATAAKLVNANTIDLFGGSAAGGGSARASLVIGAAAPSIWTGITALSGNALLEFTGGTIQTIASGASISLDGAQAFVADKAKPTSNSALTGLTTNSGTFSLSDGAVVAVGALTNNNSSTISVDNSSSSSGGSSLKLSGVLTNSGTLNIGNINTKAATVVAAGLVNGGFVTLTGLAALATLKLGSPAPATLAGTYNLQGNALLQFASGGITTIGGNLTLDGAKALVALASKPTSNSALGGLATINGRLDLEGEAALATTGALTNAGTLDVGTDFGQGGSRLTIGGTLTNNGGTIQLGNSNLVARTNLTVDGLVNTGFITLIGNGANIAVLELAGTPSSDAGTMSLDDGGALGLGTTLTVTGSLILNGGEVSGGTLAGTGLLETGSDQTGTLSHLTIAAGTTFTAQFGSILEDNTVTVAGTMTGGNSATLNFLNHGTDNMTNVSGFPTINLANGGANTLTLTDANFLNTSPVITITDGNSGNTVDAHSLSSINAISVIAGIGTDVLTGGAGDDIFTAGGKTTMTGGTGTNQFRFLAAGNNTIKDFGASSSNELVFSSSAFNLGLGGTSTPQMMTPSEAATLFTANSTGKFTTTSQRLAYDTANGQLFADANGSGGGASAHLVATLTNHPSIAAAQLFFIS